MLEPNNPPKTILLEVLLKQGEKKILKISDGSNSLESQLTPAEKEALLDGADYIEMFKATYERMPNIVRVRNYQAIKHITYVLR